MKNTLDIEKTRALLILDLSSDFILFNRQEVKKIMKKTFNHSRESERRRLK